MIARAKDSSQGVWNALQRVWSPWTRNLSLFGQFWSSYLQFVLGFTKFSKAEGISEIDPIFVTLTIYLVASPAAEAGCLLMVWDRGFESEVKPALHLPQFGGYQENNELKL
ncbi:hypothetical protein SUGI_0413100 [Cryptomeria japonica]|nr:hypothetical protein SUGI_0413100 [Cryptomeria japonica]